MLFRFLSISNKKAKRLVKDVKCGSHSGFKPCCIAWFSLVWTPIGDLERNRDIPPDMRRKFENFRTEYHKFNKPTFSGKPHPRHVLCPRCALREDFPVLKRCKCGHKMSERYPNRDFWEKVSWKFILFEL